MVDQTLTARRVQVHSWIAPDTHRRLVEVARQNDRSVAAEVRRALSLHVALERERGSETSP